MHCMACGTVLAPLRRAGRIRLVCPSCDWTFWDNPLPAVGAVVLDGPTVLLCKRRDEPRKGEWDLPGGILERGESAEEGLRREMQEELGVLADVGRLLGTWAGEYGGRPTLNLLYEVQIDGEPTAMDDVQEVRPWPLRALPDLAWAHERECLEALASGADRPVSPRRRGGSPGRARGA